MSTIVPKKTYGYSTVIKECDERTNDRGKIYLCKCKCGQMHKVSGKLLKNEKKHRSCGCSRRDRSRMIFEKNIEKTPTCWNWKGVLNRGGYGRIGTHGLAHRKSYEYAYGPISKGKQVCHTCDNRKCVNPEHLFLGTITDNMEDKVNKNRQAKGSKIASAKLTEELVHDIRKMRLQGNDYQSISSKFELTWDCVRRICKDDVWNHVPLLDETKAFKQVRRNARGEQASSKLKESEVKDIKRLIGSVRTKDIAEKYGVSQSAICDIKQGRTWGHI